MSTSTPTVSETPLGGAQFDHAGGAERPLGARRFGAVNWLGVWTLSRKEVMRFLKVWRQTILGPVVTALLFMVIFEAIIVGRMRDSLGESAVAADLTMGSVNGVPFQAFLVPGLIMMQVIQNAFANTSSSLIVSKVQGNIVDFLMPPLSASELTVCFALGGIIRGVVVAVAIAAVLAFMAPVGIAHIWAIIFYLVSASTIMALIGILGGIWAEKFDQLAFVTNFIIMPLSMLSGTFYSIGNLPGWAQAVSVFNPVFYMIDGFRYGFIGTHDGPLWVGVVAMLGLMGALGFACLTVFRTGWKLKA